MDKGEEKEEEAGGERRLKYRFKAYLISCYGNLGAKAAARDAYFDMDLPGDAQCQLSRCSRQCEAGRGAPAQLQIAGLQDAGRIATSVICEPGKKYDGKGGKRGEKNGKRNAGEGELAQPACGRRQCQEKRQREMAGGAATAGRVPGPISIKHKCLAKSRVGCVWETRLSVSLALRFRGGLELFGRPSLVPSLSSRHRRLLSSTNSNAVGRPGPPMSPAHQSPTWGACSAAADRLCDLLWYIPGTSYF